MPCQPFSDERLDEVRPAKLPHPAHLPAVTVSLVALHHSSRGGEFSEPVSRRAPVRLPGFRGIKARHSNNKGWFICAPGHTGEGVAIVEVSGLGAWLRGCMAGCRSGHVRHMATGGQRKSQGRH